MYLVLSVIMLLVSLLAIRPAPTNKLWRLKVGVTEIPFLFLFFSLATFSLRYLGGSYNNVSDIICFISMVLFFTPITRAVFVSKEFPLQFKRTFGKVDHTRPFFLAKMFLPVRVMPVKRETFVYKKNDVTELSLDFYPSALKEKSPCVIVVHGGGWDSGDSKQLDKLNFLLASQGYAVAAINYRLAPNFQSPAAMEDTQDAIAFLKQEAGKLGIDSHKLVLLGRSAGGQIALHTAYACKDSSVKGVIAFYAPADMVWAWSAPGNPLIMDSRAVLKSYIGNTFEQAPEKFHAASPLEYVGDGSTPTLLIHGVADEMVAYEHSRRLSEKLSNNKVPNLLLTLPWATHACDFTLNGPSGQVSTYAIRNFLKAVV